MHLRCLSDLSSLLTVDASYLYSDYLIFLEENKKKKNDFLSVKINLCIS